MSMSDLSDDLLEHILSFLPTKSAAATSILSKRWKTLWCSLSNLELDEETLQYSLPYCPIYSAFIDFVWGLVEKRNKIESLSLKCERGFMLPREKQLNQVLDMAVQRGLKNLSLDLASRSIRLPILRHNLITVLKLNNLKLDSEFLVYEFPLLITLHTIELECPGQSFVNLLSGCPLLKNLETRRVSADHSNWESFTSLPNLVRANICRGSYIPFGFLSTVVSLRAEKMHSSRFGVVTPFPNLTDMELNFNKLKGSTCWLVEEVFNRHCPRLQNVTIVHEEEKEEVESESDEEDGNKECLLSYYASCLLRDYKGKGCEIHLAKYTRGNSYMKINLNPSMDIHVKQQILRELSLLCGDL